MSDSNTHALRAATFEIAGLPISLIFQKFAEDERLELPHVLPHIRVQAGALTN